MPFTSQLGTADSRLGNIQLGLGATQGGGGPAPPAPGLSGSYDSVNHRVALTVTGVNADNWVIYLSDDQSSWPTLATGTFAGTSATTYDYSAPGGIRYYRAQQYDPAASPIVYSAYSGTVSVTVPAPAVTVLRDPVGGVSSYPFVLRGTLVHGAPEQRTDHWPLGSPSALVVSDGAKLEDGTVTFVVIDATSETAVVNLLTSGKVLLFAVPDGRSWYGYFTPPQRSRPSGQSSEIHLTTSWRGQPSPA